MLLDQKRTQRIVKITAVLTSIAFAGLGIVVIAVIMLGGASGATEADRVGAARERVQQQPENPAAWDQLATAEYLAGNKDAAVTASRKSISLAPRDFTRRLTLVRIYKESGQPQLALKEIQSYIDKNPNDAEAFLQLGGTADEAGNPVMARLAYQKFLSLDPENPSAAQVRQRLKNLVAGETAPQADPGG